MNTLVFEKGPHLRSRNKTSRMMVEFFVTLVILYACAVAFYFVKGGPSDEYSNVIYGLMALQNGAMGVGFAMVADLIWYFPYLFKKDEKGNPVGRYLKKVLKSYSFVTGLILVLLLPIGLEWWEIAITSFLSVFVGKLVFGGFGSNILNPAIFGRLFAQLAFSSHMTTYLGNIAPEGYGQVITAGATIPGLVNGGTFMVTEKISFWNMVLGNYYGTLGETFALIIVILGIYLVLRGIIDWRVPFFYCASLFFSYGVMFLLGGQDAREAFELAARQVMMGGVLFGGVFCLTDPVTSPTSKSGRIIFSLMAAILTMVIRLFTNSAEGVAYSILIMNLLVPLIDRCLTGRTLHNWGASLAILVCLAGVFAVGVGYGMTGTFDFAKSPSFVSSIKEVF